MQTYEQIFTAPVQRRDQIERIGWLERIGEEQFELAEIS